MSPGSRGEHIATTMGRSISRSTAKTTHPSSCARAGAARTLSPPVPADPGGALGPLGRANLNTSSLGRSMLPAGAQGTAQPWL